MKISFKQKKLNAFFKEVQLLGGVSYLVGGAVRDLKRTQILDLDGDLDFEIHNLEFERLVAQVARFFDYSIQGNFGVIVINNSNVQIASPRIENSIGVKHSDFLINIDPFMGTKLACIRRDFTVNAMLLNVMTGELIDHFNGLGDLSLGIMRHVSDHFSEDGLRILRGIRFCCRFDFKLDVTTLKLFDMMQSEYLAVNNNRVASELKMLVDAPYFMSNIELVVDVLSRFYEFDTGLVYRLQSYDIIDYDLFILVCYEYAKDKGLFLEHTCIEKNLKKAVIRISELEFGNELSYNIAQMDEFSRALILSYYQGIYPSDVVCDLNKQVVTVMELLRLYDGKYFISIGTLPKKIKVQQKKYVLEILRGKNGSTN